MADLPASPDGASVTIAGGAYIFRQGDASRALYIVQEGEVELIGPGGGVVARIGTGEVFGELSILEGRAGELGARAASECRLLRIGAAELDVLLQQPEIAAQIIRRLSRRLTAALLAGERAPVASPAAPFRPRLVHPASGVELALPSGGEALVGRADPRTGFAPEVQLAELDTQRSLSRKHARLIIKDGCVEVREEPKVANGTFVNGTRLAPGVPARINDGDEVRFGLVEMVFRSS